MLIMQPQSSAAWCHRQSIEPPRTGVDLDGHDIPGAGAQQRCRTRRRSS